jgi:hypothetical protein
MNKFIIVISILFFITCSEKKKPVMIDTNYINIDGSINNRAVFSKEIEQKNWLKNRYKKVENIWR